jgi:hypothetical protein
MFAECKINKAYDDATEGNSNNSECTARYNIVLQHLLIDNYLMSDSDERLPSFRLLPKIKKENSLFFWLDDNIILHDDGITNEAKFRPSSKEKFPDDKDEDFFNTFHHPTYQRLQPIGKRTFDSTLYPLLHDNEKFTSSHGERSFKLFPKLTKGTVLLLNQHNVESFDDLEYLEFSSYDFSEILRTHIDRR